MDNNFWISAAIAAVVGGAWLFKKGKSAYSFIRKIRRSFKGVCLNPKSRLTDEQCKKIAIGAMYASQQGAYQNSIETGIPDMLPKILGELRLRKMPGKNWTIFVKKDTGIIFPLSIRHSCWTNRKNKMKSFSRT